MGPISGDNLSSMISYNNPLMYVITWSETYFRQDLFPSYLFFRRLSHAIVIFGLKSISDLDSGSLPRFLVNSYTQN